MTSVCKWNLDEQAAQCLLCHEAPCTQACPCGADPARMIRSVRFSNLSGAASALNQAGCADCSAPCEAQCMRQMPIRQMASCLPIVKKEKSVDLSIDFCGIHCINPFFLSSSVVASNYEMCARALDMGWGGIVFKTIGFYRPNEVSPRFDSVVREGYPFLGFRNLEQISDHTLEENLGFLQKLKANYPDRVIVASIMGQTEEEWTQLAKLVTEVGCDIIECNFSCPQMTVEGMGSDVGTNPDLVCSYTLATKKGTHLPVLAKMTPNISRMEVPALAAVEAGADGLAAINTIKSVTGLDVETMSANPGIHGKTAVSGYSGKAVKPIALRFIHDMASDEQLKEIPISGMGGIETWRDALEFLSLGCSNIQITTAVMQYGYRIIEDLCNGFSTYMIKHHITQVQDLVGRLLPAMVAPEKLDRNTMVYPKFNREQCVGCGRCYISCMDAGHQALTFSVETRKPILSAQNCVGCLLCSLVCPVGAINEGTRVVKK